MVFYISVDNKVIGKMKFAAAGMGFAAKKAPKKYKVAFKASKKVKSPVRVSFVARAGGPLHILGMKDEIGGNYMKLAEMVEGGLPVGVIDTLANVVAPEDVGFSNKIVPPATLARRRSGESGLLSSEESARAVRAARVYDQAIGVWQNDVDARRFLRSPHMLLQERAPLDVAIRTDEGARVVEEILGKLKYGSAA
ncbi:MAG TPA: antitoxin Xre/MbcA/ParS toxin-binding domain-containing protein [Rhizomicrobium sp.]